MKKYLLVTVIAISGLGLYSFRSQLIGNNSDHTSTSTSSSSEETKPNVCLTKGGKQYCMPFEAAQLSTALRHSAENILDQRDEHEEKNVIKIAEYSGFLDADALKLFVESLKTLATIKKDPDAKNTAQILNKFLEQKIVINKKKILLVADINENNIFLLARAADFYSLPLLSQALGRLYIKKYAIVKLNSPEARKLGPLGQFKFAKEVYRQYWLTKKKVPAIEGKFFKTVTNEFGVSIQELLDNGRELTHSLSKRHINSLDGLLNIENIKTFTELVLNNNKLHTLQKGVFSELTALKKLFLGINQLHTLQKGVFDGLSALTSLWLNSNQLQTLQKEVFSVLAAVPNLSLKEN